MNRPKATHTGSLFEGRLDCYVLDDERRVISANGTVRALTAGAVERGDLSRYINGLPSRFAELASRPKIEVTRPEGGTAHCYEATFLADLCQAYVDALGAGELRASQTHLGVNAARLLGAFAKVGIIALVDEATGYQSQREASALSFAFRAILLESACQWDLMWPPDFVAAICRLHGETWSGGAHPAYLASTYDKLYHLVLGDAVCAELKLRNPEPKFGTNHHQWLTPEAREVVRRQIPILTAVIGPWTLSLVQDPRTKRWVYNVRHELAGKVESAATPLKSAQQLARRIKRTERDMEILTGKATSAGKARSPKARRK